jgi:glycosyltransferase involved in cell wall biosynthesis
LNRSRALGARDRFWHDARDARPEGEQRDFSLTPSELKPLTPDADVSHAPRRILMLSPRSNIIGPIPKITALLLDPLRAAGCDVTVEHWGRKTDTETLSDKVIGRARDIIRVRSRVSSAPFEVMIVKTSHEWMSLLRDVPLVAATRKHVPAIVVEFHGGNSDRLAAPGNYAFKWVTRMLFRFIDGAFVLSSEEARNESAFYPRGKFRVFVNPFESNEHDGDAPRASELPAVPTVLFAGRLLPEKGVLDTVEAVAILQARRPCHLVIAGTGPAAEDVAARVAAPGLSDAVTVAGLLSHDELAARYRSADVFVLPTYLGEGFPTVLAEAMSAGLPIVTTKLRGAADHLEEGVNALFVPPREPAALADAIGRLLDDDALRGRMSAANRAKVRDFEPVRAAEIYLQALAEIVPGTAAPV